ncbi:MAG: 30S ribosome-binding factor RbfA [Gemmatimonadetes bacterium]|nr:30S ribosome-binding factor RbfA [Gemmatimonadota bacterium]
MPGRRLSRLGEQFRRELSLKIRYSVRDPDVGPVTITGVDVTEDLWLARVFVQLQGSSDEQEKTLSALGRAAPYLRSVLGRELRIRRMPELRFQRDDSIEAGQRIEAILQDVLPPPQGVGEDAPDDATARPGAADPEPGTDEP